MFLDGVQQGSTFVSSRDYTGSSGFPTITQGFSGGGITGWMDEFRIVIGNADWTANFTPPTAPHLPSDPPRVVETLLHFDGTNGSTTFVDATGKHTWTSDGGAAHDTSQSKFGTSSAQIGQGGAWGRILGDGTINFGSTPTPFTIDFWLKLNGTQPGQINIFDLTNTSILLYIPSPGAPINFYAGGVAIAGVTNCTINVWHHVALTFDGTTQYLFLDGHLEGTWVNASIYGVASALFPLFGQGGGYSPVGWVDEARILLGNCDWTASFTPPTAPYADLR